jgi:hypothetical protein
MTTVDAIRAVHPRTANREPPSKLPEGHAGPILSDERLPLEIGQLLTDITFDADDSSSIISQGWFIAGIFSHP